MNTGTRLGLFAAGVAVVFVAAFGIGRVADLGMPGGDPKGKGAGEQMAGHGMSDATPSSGATSAAGGHGDSHGSKAAATAGAAELPAGLQVAESGLRLVLDHPEPRAGKDVPVSFRVLDADAKPVTAYTPSHDKELHLIAVRRDLSGFQHVHPTRDAAGTWSTTLDLSPGAWRFFADFDQAGDIEPVTLGADAIVAGSFAPQPLPKPSTTATVDGYTVTLDGTLAPGKDSKLTLSVSKDGTPVTDLQPYLAAYGHLVALRQGDLAYLHVHPDGEPGDGRTKPGPQIVFHTQAPSAGTYRLYLDFKHKGVVRTAEFTMTAGTEAASHGH